MASSWLPLKDSDLPAFATNYSAIVTAGPVALGLVAGDATALAALLTTYTTSLATALNPPTRTPVTIGAKDVAKAALVADIRQLTKRIQANPTVTVVQKLGLGIPVHKNTPTPIPAPVTKPTLAVVGISSGRTLTISLKDEATPDKKAKPFGVEGAEVYSYVPAAAEAPPTDLEKWRFEGLATRSSFTLRYNGEDVGKTTYVRALWFNPRGETGPESEAVTATIAA